jgi:PAS domain S-box-containing protein
MVTVDAPITLYYQHTEKSLMTKTVKSAILRYGLGVLSFALTISISLLLRHYSIRIELTLLVIFVLIGTTWYGGRGPGLLVVALFLLATVIVSSPSPQTSIGKLIFAYFNIVVLFITLVVLVSGRRNAESRLREQREWLQVTLSSIGDAVITTDLNGLINFMNPAAELLTGSTMPRAANKPLNEVLQVIDGDSHQIFELPVSQAREGMVNTITLASSDGTRRQLDYRSAHIRNQVGQTTGAVLVFSDITDRKHLEDQLRQAQKMEAVGCLAGGVAHDFNNLLTAIMGYSQLLMMRVPADDPSRQDLQEISKAGERAATLTRQLLAFSRKQVMEPKILDLNAVVGDTSKMLSRLIGEDIHLRAIFDPRLNTVEADPGQIEQVLMNLVVNARDAMPHGGRITIETSNVELDEAYTSQHVGVRPGQYVMIAVSDTGCGMDAETQARIFEPFFTTKEVGKGTGLGLSTVYGIVKQSGGHIWIYSETGRGTTFKVYLPPAKTGTETWKPAAQPSLLPGGTETVLLAEDEVQVRDFAARVLRELGYTVIEARNGREAITAASEAGQKIDILLTDVIMPEMGGKSLSDWIRGRIPGVKVLFISGYTEGAISNLGELNPGVAFLQKPFTPGELARKVRELLNAPVQERCARGEPSLTSIGSKGRL